MNQKLSQLTICHNHGQYVIKDVELIPQGPGREHCFTARGTVVSGGQTSRLFHATSFRPEPVGEVREYDIWNRRIHDNRDGTHYVDICTCG